MTERSAGAVEDELAKRELLLGEAERIVHLGSWMWNTETNAIRWSDEMFRILGYDPGSVVPTVEGFFGAIHPSDRARVEAVTKRGVVSRMPEPVDFRLMRHDMSIRYVHMEGAIAHDAGALCVVGTVLDVTEKREVAARLLHSEKMEAIGTLAGGVAHDFSNYLQVILGHVRMLSSSPSLDARSAASANQIAVAAGRCERLTRELLSFARRTTLKRERIDLRLLVERTSPSMQALVGSRVRIFHEADKSTPLFIEGDEASLEQALMNLAANARDAMPQGGTLTLTTEACDEAPEGQSSGLGGVRLSLRDNGCGMSPSVAERVFEPFFSTKTPGQGTGLGLASVHVGPDKHLSTQLHDYTDRQ